MEPVRLANLPARIFLKTEFRDALFCKAYLKAGSLGGIARVMGYLSRPGINGVSRDMWLGRRSIPRDRIASLLKLTNISVKELAENVISREASVETTDWLKCYEDYRSHLHDKRTGKT